MSLHVLADHMASKGRGPDSMLVHMSPSEVAGLHALALKHGGSLTVNPDTGLPEAGFLDKLLPTIIGAGISYFSGGAIDPMTAAAMVGGAETVRTGSLERGLMAGMGAYGGAGLSAGFMGAGAAGLTGEAAALAGQQATEQGLTEAAKSQAIDEAARAQGFNEAVGKTAASDVFSKGVSSAAANPMQFAKDNWKYLAGAASPIVADLMVPTTTKQPDIQSNDTINQFIYGPTGYRRLNPVPAKNYGTPAWKSFNEGGIVALAGGGDLNNIYANLGGKEVYDKITADYLKAGGTEAGLPSIFSAYDKPVAAPAAAAPVVAAPAAPNLNNIYANLGGKQVYDTIASNYIKAGGTEAGLPSILSQYDKPVAATAAVAPAGLTADQKAALDLMYKSSTGGVNASAFDALGGNAAVRDLATQAGYTGTPTWMSNYEQTMGYKPSASTVANTKLATDNLPGLYASLGGGDVTKGKAAYDKIAADYTKAGGNVANLPSILYDETAGTFYNPERLSTNSTFKANNLGYSEEDVNRYVNSDAAKTLARLTGKPITAESHIQDTLASGKQFATMSGLFSPEEVAKMSNKQLLAAAELYTQGGGARKINGFTQQDVDFIRNEANNYGGLLYSANFQAIGDKGDVIGRQGDEAAGRYGNGTADTTGIAALDRVDAGADTRLDYTGDGTSTVKPVAVTSSGTYNKVAGNTYVPPAIGTAVGQGTYQGQGTMASTGTQGPIVDFTGKTAFTSNPLTLAKQQIADKAAAKTAADATKLDLYRQFGIQNPTATELDHANFIDKIGLAPETAAQLLNISPDQAKDKYYNAKFNQQTGDSMAAYKYLMGQGAYPTKSGVGEIARPYAEATLGMPANTNRQYIYDQATGKYNRNPDYVAEYKDPSGGTNYLMSPKEIFNYFKTNANQDDAVTYAWALANNLTPKEIADATGVPISQITPKWRAAAANKVATEVKNEDGTINKEATDQKIAEKAAADKAAADAAADKAVKDSWDEAAYLAANPDVAAELSTGKSVSGKPVKFTSGYEHFTSFGKAEGRKATTKAAGGGMMGYAVGGGLGSLGSYSDGGRLLKGPGDGVSDSIPATIGQKQQPARLADGEFVVPARIVSELGNGSTEAGAKKLYAMMDRVQRARGKTTGKNKVAANSRADKYLPA